MEARALLKFDAQKPVLQQRGLDAIAELPSTSPVYVLAAIGDTRSGKSTVLSMLLNHVANEPTEREIFVASNAVRLLPNLDQGSSARGRRVRVRVHVACPC
jgi:ABC-type antimicrobial peptide transport system ATPase subunit